MVFYDFLFLCLQNMRICLTNSFSPNSLLGSDILVIFASNSINNEKNMEAITFTPAQLHVLNLMSRIRTSGGLEKLRQQVAAFCAKQIDEEMDQLWENGQFDEKRMQELRGSHFRTPYKK